MRLRSFDVCVRAMLCGALLLPVGLQAQAPAPAAAAAPVAATPPAQAEEKPAAPTVAQRPVITPKGQKPLVPDYPDARTLTVGAFYFGTVPGEGPDLRPGRGSRGLGTINGMGKARNGIGVYAAVPLSRTSELRVEVFRTKGAGNQTLKQDTFVFGNQFYNKDLLSNSYRVVSGKIWIDDLFWPHKFPVGKFRVKALYGVRYLAVKGSIDAPLQVIPGSTLVVGSTATGNKQVILPAIGLAPEYAISKHVLFRVEASGFGLPKKSALWDSEATLSWRKGKWEIFGGGKAIGFKTSPIQDFNYSGQIYGGVFGLKYHWQ